MSRWQLCSGLVWSLGICMFLWTFFGLISPPAFPAELDLLGLFGSFFHFSMLIVFGGIGYSFMEHFFHAPYHAEAKMWRRLLTWGVGLVVFQFSIFVVGISLGVMNLSSNVLAVLTFYALSMWIIALALVFKGYSLLMEIRSNNGFNRTPESCGPAKPGEFGGGAG